MFTIKESKWKMRNKTLPFFSTGYYLSNGINKRGIRKNWGKKIIITLEPIRNEDSKGYYR